LQGIRYDMRRQIAYLAARLMAENGISDFAIAKQKAARQAGTSDTNSLPDNREIEIALRAYQALFLGDEQPKQLHRLRELALEAMRLLSDFKPLLTGSVLKGTAGAHSGIDLQLFANDSKEVELFLINHGIIYRTQLRHVCVGGKSREIPVLRLEFSGAQLSLAVFPALSSRITLKNREGSSSLERAGIREVAAMLTENP